MHEQRQLTISIDEDAYIELVACARNKATTPGKLAATLFCGAFAILRTGDGPMGDLASLLWIAGHDTVAISRVTGLSEVTIVAILDKNRRKIRTVETKIK